MAWTEKEVETLLALNENGMSAAEIAKHVGRSRSAVIGKLHRMADAGDPRLKNVALGTPPGQPRPITLRRRALTDKEEDAVDLILLHGREPVSTAKVSFTELARDLGMTPAEVSARYRSIIADLAESEAGS